MSIIVHAPQGAGKSLHALALLRAFKLGRIVDHDGNDLVDPDCFHRAVQLPRGGLYHAWLHQPHRGQLERMRLLILTSEAPSIEASIDQRVMSLDQALKLANVNKLETQA